MGDAGYFKGTSAEQDARFSNKEKKLLKAMNFPPEFNQKVDMKKVRLDLIKQGIARRLVELLGVDDDVVVEYAFGMLEEQFPDPKMMQINLQGFLGQNAQSFVLELWKLLLSAQTSLGGIPKELLEKAKQDVLRSKTEKDAALAGVMNQEAKERAMANDIRERAQAIVDAMGTGVKPEAADIQAAPAPAPPLVPEANMSQNRDRHHHHRDESKERGGSGDQTRDRSRDRSRERRGGRDRGRAREILSSSSSSGRRDRSKSRDGHYRSDRLGEGQHRRHREEQQHRTRYPSRERREDRPAYSSHSSSSRRDLVDRERVRDYSRERRYRDRSRSRSRSRSHDRHRRRRRSPEYRKSSRDERGYERERERERERDYDRRHSRMDQGRKDSASLPEEPRAMKRRRSRSRSKSRSRSRTRRGRSPVQQRSRSRTRSTSRPKRRASPSSSPGPAKRPHVDNDHREETSGSAGLAPASNSKDSVQLEKELREELLRKRALNSMKANQAAKARATVEGSVDTDVNAG